VKKDIVAPEVLSHWERYRQTMIHLSGFWYLTLESLCHSKSASARNSLLESLLFKLILCGRIGNANLSSATDVKTFLKPTCPKVNLSLRT
jgi:hypothetical protein